MNVKGKTYRTVWLEKSRVKMINQPVLPFKFEILEFENAEEVAKAIKEMVVRGAGAIGATAGYGLAIAAANASEKYFAEEIGKAEKILKASRPTAYDLFYFTDRVKEAALSEKNAKKGKEAAIAKAKELAKKQVEMCERIGEQGEKLLERESRVLTHCNAGWLAFVDWGSAMAPIYKAKRAGKKIFVWVDETRPRLQGARLTAWELANEKIGHKVIADNAAGHFMQKGEVDLCIVGADRVAENGDVANKIGTYEKAVLAKENGIPFYVAAPLSTFDLGIKSGKEIPIEERSEEEVLFAQGKAESSGKTERIRLAAEESKAANPAFDITPAKYITGIITPKGIIKANNNEIKKIF
jgi:methylthioribose-1-phosphate isomerase